MELSGLVSGLDVKSLIAQLMSVERMPVSKKILSQDILEKKSQIFSDIKGRLSNLENYSKELTDESSFKVFSAAYSEDSIVSAGASSGASSGIYSLVVNNLARAHTIGSDQQTDSTTALGLSGDVVINGFDVTINSTDTLEDIRNTINNTEDIDVTASIVDNVLRIKSNNTGATDMTFVDDAVEDTLTSLGILDGADAIKNEFIAARDASFTIDGQAVTNSDNIISDVIEGVTLTLLEEGSVDLTVSRDTGTIIGKIKDFVNQYNSVVEFIHENISEKKIIPAESNADKMVGLVSGDMSLQGIKTRLNTLMTDIVNGLDDDVNQFSRIGISKTEFAEGDGVESDVLIGKLNIDEDVLKEAINDDFDSIVELFTKNTGTEGLDDSEYGVAARVYDYMGTLTSTTEGMFTYKENSLQMEIDMIEDQIDSYNRRLELREANLKKKYLSMELALASMDTQSSWLSAQLGY